MASKNLRELRMSTAMSSLTVNRTRSTLAPSLSESATRVKKVQCNLDLVTFFVSAKTVTESHNVTKLNDFM